MALEKLKSVFNDNSKFKNLDKSIHVNKNKSHVQNHSLLDLKDKVPSLPNESIHINKNKSHVENHSLLDPENKVSPTPAGKIPSPISNKRYSDAINTGQTRATNSPTGEGKFEAIEVPWWQKDTSEWNIDGNPSFETTSL